MRRVKTGFLQAALAMLCMVMTSGCISMLAATRPLETDETVRGSYESDAAATEWVSHLSAEEIFDIEDIGDGQTKCLTGKITWKKTGVHWFGLKDAELLLLDTETGEPLWSIALEGGNVNGTLETENGILVQGRRWTRCYDRRTGELRWERTGDNRHGASTYAAWANLGVDAWREEGGFVLTGFDLESGNELWRRRLGDVSAEETSLKFYQKNESFVAVTDTLYEISHENGEILMSAELDPPLASDPRLTFTDDGIILCRGKAVEVIDGSTGRSRWSGSTGGSEILDFTFSPGTLAAVSGGEEQVRLEVFDMETGERRWQSRLNGEYVGPCTVEEGVLYLTTVDALRAFDTDTGKVLRVIELPAHLRRGVVLPDNLLILEDLLIVARERGIAAFDPGDGHTVYSHYVTGTERYSYAFLSQKHRIMQMCMAKMKGKSFDTGTLYDRIGGTGNSFSPMWNDYWQSQTDYHRQMWEDSQGQWDEGIRREQFASSVRTQYRHQKKMAKMDLAVAQAEFYASTVVAAFQIAGVIAQEALKDAVELVHRKAEQAVRTHERSIQGSYYIRPFYRDRRGLCLIDLSTGERAEITISPYHETPPVNLPDLPAAALSRNGEMLLARVLTDEPESVHYTLTTMPAYERFTVFNWVLPCPSVARYRLEEIDFSGPVIQEDGFVPRPQLSPEEEAFIEAVIDNDLEAVNEAIEEGVDLNVVDEHDMSPVFYAAAFGSLPMIKSLVEAGIDCTLTDHELWYPIQYPTFVGAPIQHTAELEEPLLKHLKEEGRDTRVRDYR